MRVPATLFAAVLAAGMFAGSEVAPCHADVTTDAVPSAAAPAPDANEAPVPGTQEEERAYAQREAASPKAQEFAGGWVIGFLILVALVVLIVLLVKKGEL